MQDEEAHYGWFWQLRNLPDEPESRYLYTIMAGHDFQEGLKNYRDLTSSARPWRPGRTDTGLRRHDRYARGAYAQRLPQVDPAAGLRCGRPAAASTRRALETRLRTIESQPGCGRAGHAAEREQWEQIQRIEAALAGTAETTESPEQRARRALGFAPPSEQWQRVQRAQAGLAGLPDTPENDELRERLALVKGVLLYQLTDAFKARQWQEHRTLKDLDLALHEAQSRWIRVDRARQSVPTNTGEFATRLAALKTRIEACRRAWQPPSSASRTTWPRSP